MARAVRKAKCAPAKKVLLAPIPAVFKFKTMALLLLVAAAVAIATVAFVFWFYDVQVIKYDMHLTVAANMGFNVATDAIWFGKVPPTMTATRTLELHNDKNGTRIASLYFFGALADWVFVNEGTARFVLGPGEARNVMLSAKVPDEARAGPVDGWVLVVFRKP